MLDRAALGLPPAALPPRAFTVCAQPRVDSRGTVVLQGTGVTNAFVTRRLPLTGARKASTSTFTSIRRVNCSTSCPPAEREHNFPGAHQQEAMGITDFTLATMTRWVRSDYGRAHSLHPFRHRHFLGSGSGAVVMAEAGLDGASQFEAIRDLRSRPLKEISCPR